MAITPESFAVWTGFQPGAEFKPSPFAFQDPGAWYNRVPANAETKVAPVIPVFHEGSPDAEYWRTEVSKLEWAAVSPLWIAVAKAILRYDPYFNPYRNDWFVDGQGNWTQQFRQHQLFGVMAAELGARMREHIDFSREFINAINNPAPAPPPPPSGLAEVLPQHQSVAEGLWGRLAGWARDGFTMAKLFTPEGLGWMVAWEATRWGLHKYQDYQQERERQRNQHRPKHRQLAIELGEQEGIDFEAAWAEVPEIPSFATGDFRLQGLFVTKAPVQGFDWREQRIGGPEVLVSHDGVYH